MSSIVNTIAGAGGLKPQIIVTAPTGSTVTCDGVVGTESSGTWTFNVGIGTHTVVATKGSNTASATVNVDCIAIFNVALSWARLPSGFQEVEYIQNTTTQYIDTGYLASGSINFELKTRILSTNTTCIFGSFETNKHISAHAHKQYTVFFKYQFNYYQTGENTQDVVINTDNTMVFTDGTFYIDGTSVFSQSEASFTSTQTLYYMYVNGLDVINAQRAYYCKVWDGTTLVRNLVPCYCTEAKTGYKGTTAVSVASGTIGLYDLVGNRFYVNSGTGTFTKGDDV